MDRLNELRSEARDPRDSTLDTSSPPSEAYMSANESSSKYFSLSEVDSTFSISPSKDATASTAADSESTDITADAEIITALSPIPKKTDIDTFKIGKHIEAANILSGGVNIFDDNENSYDGDELVIDDNVTLEDEKSNAEIKLREDVLTSEKTEETLVDTMDEAEAIPSKDTEVVLQIDGKNVDAIDIGNGLYLYRKAGEEELAAVQITDDDQQQQSFKFLKVRENNEGNLEVYEEIEVEIPKEVPVKDGRGIEKFVNVPIKDINKVINEPTCNKTDKVTTIPKIKSEEINSTCALTSDPNIDFQTESKSEVNLNGKTVKIEQRKSPLISTYTTYHSTPNKEGIPLTKTMVDLQLHPSRHSDNIKKTIEVHTDCNKPKSVESTLKTSLKEEHETTKMLESGSSVVAEDCNNPMEIVECGQKELELNKTPIKNLVCTFTDKNNDVPNESLESDIKENVEKLPQNHEINGDQKVISAEMDKVSNVSKELQTKNEQNMTSQQLNNVVPQYQEKQEKSQDKLNTSFNENIVSDNDCGKNLNQNTINQNKLKKHENIDKNIENYVILDKSLKKNTEVDFTAHPSGLNSTKELQAELIDPINDQFIKRSESRSIAEIKNIPEENKDIHDNIQEVNDVTPSTKIVMPSSNSIVDKVDNSYKVCVSTKDKVEDTNINLKINEDTRIEVDNPETDLKNSEKNKRGLQVAKPDVYIGDVLPSENTNSKKDDKIQEGIIKNNKDKKDTVCSEKVAMSLVSSQKFVLETVKSTKPEVDSSKISTRNKPEVDSSKISTKNILGTQKVLTNDKKSKDITVSKIESKPKGTTTKINNSNSAVPFGQWTEANRQEFLIKIKETKVPSNNCNTNQIKQTNDLNRRDILKKFDSQRLSNFTTITVPAKVPDFGTSKFSSKIDNAAFVNKSTAIHQSNSLNPIVPSIKTQSTLTKQKPAINTKASNEEPLDKEVLEQRVINSQEIIDKTIEGIITKSIKINTIPDHMKEQKTIHTVENPKDATPLPGSLDDIEMKMNELHGISFTERSVQELSQDNHNSKVENINKISKIPKLIPFKGKEQQIDGKESMRDNISDEEIIEHEPITGDIDVSKQNLISLLSSKEKPLMESKKDAIITEKDFDKFARRNSITYENYLTVNFDGKEHHNVIQTIVEKDTSVRKIKMSRNEILLAESKAKSSSKQNTAGRHNQTTKTQILKSVKEEDSYNKNYQSKVQIAYQSALTAKRNLECPITIIEDKPVKVVYNMDSEFTSTQLDVQGQELSPSKNPKAESNEFVYSASEYLDSDNLDSSQDSNSQDEIKSKSKHQRKQVLTPVEEEPEIQLIEPADLGIKVSTTKKRRIEEKTNKNLKSVVPKKSYLLNRSIVEDNKHTLKPDLPKNIFKETETRNDTFIGHTDTITAIDNLVKAAELIETQSEKSTNVETNQTNENSPIKRGRGRPRKYPLPESGSETAKPSSPLIKPRLIDARVTKTYTDSDESSDGEVIKENWTMGKINENIVCPICNKLFRSENVVFKHVKHCTGPSPNRSESDKTSPRRLRNSLDRKLRDSRSDDTDSDDEETIRTKSNDSVSKPINDDDIIVIEDTPVKNNSTDEKVNQQECKKVMHKTKLQHDTTNLICEFCGKSFRQLSYLVSHKLQHKNENTKKHESELVKNKTVFSCEICKKVFRKLHHLVQHRIIHNPTSAASRLHRKTSFEVHETKNSKPQTDDASAGFRCEPCDKSFRKLHHLVEHRETHDGINKKGSTMSQSMTESSKPLLAHHCEVCKKVFKNLQDLLDHKEQHYETSSEKSDDKSVKSSLSTKDIIHECSLCYMVFPNEHSLNKHTIICLRKKKQSAAKQAAKLAESKEANTDDISRSCENISDVDTIPDQPSEEDLEVTENPKEALVNDIDTVKNSEHEGIKKEIEQSKPIIEEKIINVNNKPKKRHSNLVEKIKAAEDIETPAKIKKVEEKGCITIFDTPTPKKKMINKDKIATKATKRHKTVDVPLVVTKDSKPTIESSEDEDIRYMLNPNYKEEESSESKVFMKIRALKRNSLQIERPSSKDLVKRRISLQHPPKMPRLKAKAVEAKPLTRQSVENKLNVTEATSTDSEDSEVKYSFPDKIDTKISSKGAEKKIKRRSLPTKRKSLTGVANRKSLGKLPNKPKRRSAVIEHRCDCGQLFSSAALLSRHTTMAHTPPRRRRCRSPPPDDTKPDTKPQITKPAVTKPAITKPAITKPAVTKPAITKSVIPKPATTKPVTKPKPNTPPKKPKCDVTNSNKTANVEKRVATRKTSLNNNSATKLPNDVGKSKNQFSSKSLRSAKRSVI